jgi:hypothetical protein
MQSSTVNQSAYFDEAGILAPNSNFRRDNNPRRESGEERVTATTEENNKTVNYEEASTQFSNNEQAVKADLRNLDEFTPYNPLQQREREHDGNQERKKRQQRRIGASKRTEALEEDFDEEQVFAFLSFLDRLWLSLSEIVESVSREFENWNKWFKKKEKKLPPAPDKSRIAYIREEFQAQRSPHLWKTNPDRKWILTFGNSKINNVISSILYKYQNETISKDA